MKIIDYVEANIAYYFAKDRPYAERGYRKITYTWEYLPTRHIGNTDIFIRGSPIHLLMHWNSKDHRWRYDLQWLTNT